uniref:Lipoprotein n=1 Tax=Haemonchus contortus TaxID=6289 RepID=A0A7I5EED9_HAECO
MRIRKASRWRAQHDGICISSACEGDMKTSAAVKAQADLKGLRKFETDIQTDRQTDRQQTTNEALYSK